MASFDALKFFKWGPEKNVIYYIKLDFFPIIGFDKPGSEPVTLL
jgi:hypothetical protein